MSSQESLNSDALAIEDNGLLVVDVGDHGESGL